MNRLLDVDPRGPRQGRHRTPSVSGREKTIYSVYKKMREKRYTFSQVFDIYGVRVLVADTTDVLRGARRAARAVQADPRQVQGLHRDPEGERLPVAAHDAVRPVRHAARSADPHARHAPRSPRPASPRTGCTRRGGELDLAEAQRETHRWLQSLLEIQSESRDSKEFLEHIKGDLFPDEIYVFTPKGKIMALPRGATAVDFAYGVHTDIGHHCVAARINYELLPLRTELKNGDHVEILTSPTARPNPSWLSFVATGKARSRIRHFLKGLQQKESAALGERMLEPGAGDAEGRARSDHVGPLGSAREGVRREEPARDPRRHRARQAAVVRRRAGADARARQGGRGRSAPRRRSRGADAARRRRRRDPVREVLPADSRRHDRRPVPQGPGPRSCTLRDCVTLKKQRVDAGRARRRRMGARRAGRVRRRHPRAGRRPARPARRPRDRDRRRARPTSTPCRWSGPTAATCIAMFFGVQVRDRRHLAHVMRGLKRVADVRRVQRTRT